MHAGKSTVKHTVWFLTAGDSNSPGPAGQTNLKGTNKKELFEPVNNFHLMNILASMCQAILGTGTSQQNLHSCGAKTIINKSKQSAVRAEKEVNEVLKRTGKGCLR